MENLKDLLVEHDYYCSESNYYSNDAANTWENWENFHDEYKNADVDMNLVFRWDLKEKINEDGDKIEGYCMEVFMIHQRKGIFAPHIIENVNESDLENIKSYLQPHFDKLKSIWTPFK